MGRLVFPLLRGRDQDAEPVLYLLQCHAARGGQRVVLPKQGKTLAIEEWTAEGRRRHIFTWNGMKPVFSKTEDVSDDDFSLRVSFKGAQPNVKDFLTAYLSQEDMGESLADIALSWKLYKNGMKLMPGDSFIVDVQNGYIGYESVNDDGRKVIECCYWNYADKRHKLLAINDGYFRGEQPVMTESTGITFYKYDNATRKMNLTYEAELGLEISLPSGTTGVTYELPRQGKTMTVNCYTASGKKAGRYTWIYNRSNNKLLLVDFDGSGVVTKTSTKDGPKAGKSTPTRRKGGSGRRSTSWKKGKGTPL